MITFNNTTHVFFDLLKVDNTIPSFLSASDWSYLFNYLSSGVLLESILNFNFTNTSSLINNTTSFVALFNNDLLNFACITLFVIIFAQMYSKTTTKETLVRINYTVQRFWVVNVIWLFLSFVTYITSPSSNQPSLFDDMVQSNLVISFILLIAISGLHLFVNSLAFTNTQTSPETPILTYLVLGFGWVLLTLDDFALFIVALEGFSLTLYILATTGRTYGGVSASIKYFVFGTLGSILLYWGGISIFELTASMKVETIFELSFNSADSNVYLKAIWAQSFILLGFLIKLGAAPLHQWIADVYAGVPLFVTAFYSTFVKLVLFILFLRFAVNFASTSEVEYAALLSLLIGCFGTLRQVEVKRFLAYGSITHTGYLLMGDLTATYVYLATYMLASFVFFSVLLSLRLNGQEFTYLSDLRFIGQSASQFDRVMLVIALASMAGLPPFAGFYGKMFVWMSLMEDVYLFNDLWSFVLLLFNILTSLIVMFYYAQVMCILYVNDESLQSMQVTSVTIQPDYFYGLNNNITKIVQRLGTLLLLTWTFIMPSLLGCFYSITL